MPFQVRVNAVEATYVRTGYGLTDRNYGNTPNLTQGDTNYRDYDKTYCYFKFDPVAISSFDAGNILSIDFYFFASAVLKSGEPINLHKEIYAVTEDWNVNTITYDSHPSTYEGSIAYQEIDPIPGTYFSVHLDAQNQPASFYFDYIRQYGIELTGSHSGGNYVVTTINGATADNNIPYMLVTLSTETPVFNPMSPISQYVDGSETVRFQWQYQNAVGGAQQSAELQYSTNLSEWTTFATISGNNAYYDVPINTLPSGIVYWRGRLTSQYDTVSAWSAVSKIIVVSSPIVTNLEIASSPMPSITWSAGGQQAYQLCFGAYCSGVIFGTQKSAKSPVYLSDGSATIGVRCQNSYGLWSSWSTVIITVANVPGTDITLTGSANHRAILQWGAEEGDFVVLRDGKKIAEVTDAGAYTDQFCLGRHTYRVMELLDGDNYTLSNEVTLTMRTAEAIITDVEDVNWLKIGATVDDDQTESETVTRDVRFVHYAGRDKPVAEVAPFVDSAVSFAVAFPDGKAAAEFTALLSKTVCYKSPSGRCLIGVIAEFARSNDTFFDTYDVTIRETDPGELHETDIFAG